jgi:hypothetical protein
MKFFMGGGQRHRIPRSGYPFFFREDALLELDTDDRRIR